MAVHPNPIVAEGTITIDQDGPSSGPTTGEAIPIPGTANEMVLEIHTGSDPIGWNWNETSYTFNATTKFTLDSTLSDKAVSFTGYLFDLWFPKTGAGNSATVSYLFLKRPKEDTI